MKQTPIRHSDIYTVAVPNCLRILRTDATIYVTAEDARQFLDNLDNGELFELSAGTPTTVSIELTAEEAQHLKTSVKAEFATPNRRIRRGGGKRSPAGKRHRDQ